MNQQSYKTHTVNTLISITVILHSLFVLFMSLGFLFALLTGNIINTAWGTIFFLAFLLTGTQQIVLKGCVLTTVEKKLRKRINPNLNYRGTFLSQYVPFMVGKGLTQKQVVSMHFSIAAALGLVILFLK